VGRTRVGNTIRDEASLDACGGTGKSCDVIDAVRAAPVTDSNLFI
jgi:hypothetical protein